MRVGIVVPAWNVAAYLGDALGSVLAQTHGDWRLVVVDDGSTDATAAVARRIGDARVSVLLQENRGVSVARNRGAAALDDTCEAVLFLDGDDWLAPDALARLVDALRREPGAVAAAGAHVAWREGGGKRASRSRALLPPSGDVLLPLLLRNRFANCGQVLIRHAAASRIGPFRPDLAYGEDWDYLVRLALLGPFVPVQGGMPVLHMRVRAGGACHRLASRPAAFHACIDAIFANQALKGRFGTERIAELRRRAEAESQWIIGRELMRHGRFIEGRAYLRRSFRRLPSVRRLVLLSAAYALPALPVTLRGPFVPYPAQAGSEHHAA
jgi:glycosyltransferase involved in cell wall biosynthesis